MTSTLPSPVNQPIRPQPLAHAVQGQAYFGERAAWLSRDALRGARLGGVDVGDAVSEVPFVNQREIVFNKQ